MTCHMLLKVSTLPETYLQLILYLLVYTITFSQLNKLHKVKQDMITHDEMERVERKRSWLI